MLRRILSARLDKEEKLLGESLAWARYVLDKSGLLFFKYLLSIPLLTHRKHAVPEAISISRLIAVQGEDCGSCLQIEVNLARSRKVDAEIVRRVLRKQYDLLDPVYACVARFAEAVTKRDGTEMETGGKVKELIGEKAFVEISMAIATAKFYPTIKRAMGFSTSCAIDGIKV